MAPGPTWVPIVAPREQTGSWSVCPLQRASLSFDIFLQHLIAESGVTEAAGSGKIDSVCLFYFLHEKIIPVFGAACLAEHDDLAFRYGDDRFDRHGAAEKCGGGGDAAAFFQIFQCIQDTESVDLLLGGF